MTPTQPARPEPPPPIDLRVTDDQVDAAVMATLATRPHHRWRAAEILRATTVGGPVDIMMALLRLDAAGRVRHVQPATYCLPTEGPGETAAANVRSVWGATD